MHCRLRRCDALAELMSAKAHVGENWDLEMCGLAKSLWRFFKKLRSLRKTVDSSTSERSDMDLSLPALPISFPLTSLEQLNDGSLFTSFHFPFDKCSVPLVRDASCSSKQQQKKAKLLVCHDMKGGYQDDKYVQGDANDKAYSLWHWQCIDIFVYFSHSLVTIPPPSWMNAGHLHGVQVLGTFITEWDQGAETCKTLLASKESARMYASRLAIIAFNLGFDGWLINIENVIPMEQIETLVEFVSHLTTTMHDLVPDSVVIWYDAVTVQGKLDWQDLLNEKNKPFFDVCDGIFINYTWKKNYPKESAKAAGDRAFDVYMGVDVFGRNTYGGGGYQSDVALKAALEGGVSAALFAPGWVYETNQGPTFEDAQNRYWASIHASWPIAHKNPVALPFYSDFSQGFGRAMYIDGEEVSALPWSNISCQNLQPLLNVVADSTFQVSVRSEDSIYSGGSSLRFLGQLETDEVYIAELYRSNLLLTNAAPLAVDFSVSPKADSQFCLVLNVQDSTGTAYMIFLSSSVGKPEHNVVNIAGKSAPQGYKLKLLKSQQATNSSWVLSDFKLEVEEGSAITNIYGLSYFKDLNYHEISERIATKAEPAAGGRINRKLLKPLRDKKTCEIHLGHIRITNSAAEEDCFMELQTCTLQGVNLKWSKNSNGDRFVSVKLTWEFQNNDTAQNFSRYNLYTRQSTSGKANESNGDEDIKYLGVAFVQAFYVDALAIATGKTLLEFHLQARCLSGSYQNIKENPVLSIDIPSQSSPLWEYQQAETVQD